ncbi:MAG: NAD-dependent protein deacylase [Armatimonadetes bacterium]|nr:NAD-dependent protein deacylase [Armatimonadota bacterium]
MKLMTHKIDELVDAFANARSVFVFTGAGASKESGLPTFREIDGEWNQYDPMTYATLDGFLSEPVRVWNMYRLRQRQIGDAQPNAAHIVIAQMESRYPHFLLTTQNVDDLHERAGSRKMVKIHGDCWGMRCMHCSEVFDTREFSLPDEFTSETLPRCPHCEVLCRPNIVWFGEFVPDEAMFASIERASSCDVMLVVGTSGEVSGGYGFVERASMHGATIVEINPTEGILTQHAHLWIPEPAGVALPKLWQSLTGLGRNSLPPA